MARFPLADGADVYAGQRGKPLGSEAKRLAGGFEVGGGHRAVPKNSQLDRPLPNCRWKK